MDRVGQYLATAPFRDLQLGYKGRTDTKMLERNISRLKGSSEFFVQKAIGWALRDYARTDPDFVLEFVGRHDLKTLSRREALKRLPAE